jgi:hypothetical protein
LVRRTGFLLSKSPRLQAGVVYSDPWQIHCSAFSPQSQHRNAGWRSARATKHNSLCGAGCFLRGFCERRGASDGSPSRGDGQTWEPVPTRRMRNDRQGRNIPLPYNKEARTDGPERSVLIGLSGRVLSAWATHGSPIREGGGRNGGQAPPRGPGGDLRHRCCPGAELPIECRGPECPRPEPVGTGAGSSAGCGCD